MDTQFEVKLYTTHLQWWTCHNLLVRWVKGILRFMNHDGRRAEVLHETMITIGRLNLWR